METAVCTATIALLLAANLSCYLASRLTMRCSGTQLLNTYQGAIVGRLDPLSATPTDRDTACKPHPSASYSIASFFSQRSRRANMPATKKHGPTNLVSFYLPMAAFSSPAMQDEPS
ncbi:hypothetical protein HDV64DRAFT_10083 [Trichoderma sp. TUCIM 5745]